MTTYTIQELAMSKGTSEPVRQALFSLSEQLDAARQAGKWEADICQQAIEDMNKAVSERDALKAELELTTMEKNALYDKAIEEALAEPEPEPVGYVYTYKGHAEGALNDQTLKAGAPLYTRPAP